MCVCVCVHVMGICSHAHIFEHSCGYWRPTPGIFLSHPIPYFLRKGLLLKLELTILARLSSVLQGCAYLHIQVFGLQMGTATPGFFYVSCKYELKSSWLEGKHLTD